MSADMATAETGTQTIGTDVIDFATGPLAEAVEAAVMKAMPLVIDALDGFERRLLEELRSPGPSTLRAFSRHLCAHEYHFSDNSLPSEQPQGQPQPIGGLGSSDSDTSPASGRRASPCESPAKQLRPLATLNLSLSPGRPHRDLDNVSEFSGQVSPAMITKALQGGHTPPHDRIPSAGFLTLETLERASDEVIFQNQRRKHSDPKFSSPDISPKARQLSPKARKAMSEEFAFQMTPAAMALARLPSMLTETGCHGARSMHGASSGDNCVPGLRDTSGRERKYSWKYSSILRNMLVQGVKAQKEFSSIAPTAQPKAASDCDSTQEDQDAELAASVSCTDLTSMREERQEELLVRAALTSNTLMVVDHSAPFWLCACGILPWPTSDHNSTRTCTLTRACMLALLLCSMSFYLHQFLTQLHEGNLSQTCETVFCLRDTLSPTLAIGLGGFLRLLSFCLSKEQIVGKPYSVLSQHLKSMGLSPIWETHACRDMAKILLCWACMIAACIYASFTWDSNGLHAAFHIAALAFITNIFMALVFSILHICRGLSLSIDYFCLRIVQAGACERAVEDWNMLQAILRRVCITIARSYVMLLTSALAAALLPTIFHRSLQAMLPGAVALVFILWVSLCVGDITSKCDRVPIYINTLDFGSVSFDEKRQYVVNYINNSRAGCYMFDVRVTGEMVIKCAYVAFLLAFAFITSV